ncbi:MAG: preprotein translocase subunit SecG [Burkholderiales bacterium]|jgi:preprotein translocase subunit SecG|nr:preprotein translocase subunit SecG [Betaproteobacteria bacterium]
METVLQIIHVIAVIAIIGLVLLQQGKGADAGAAFGGGNSAGLFGASGSANFLSRATAIAATVFFCTSLALTWMSNRTARSAGVVESVPLVPATPANGGAGADAGAVAPAPAKVGDVPQ